MGGRGLYIRDWEPNFNPLLAPIEEVPIWLHLYNLPKEYWNEESFQAIGNKLGFYIKANETIESKDFSMYARICISWKPHFPLPAHIEIITNAGQWLHKIEVEETSERCKYCKKDGHTENTCPIGPKGKNVETTMKEEVKKFVRKENEMGGKETENGTPQSPQQPFLQGEVSAATINRTSVEDEIVMDVSLINKHLEAAGWVEEAIVRVEKEVEVLDKAKSRASLPVGMGQTSKLAKKSKNFRIMTLKRMELMKVERLREMKMMMNGDGWTRKISWRQGQ
ncbi:uncharacterized protein LOC131062848 [Cryptomeria japonica]|uniref:uncharacterized protein LOC131062848 n=1 Tax=Cryptomeria japonica TaxID=3369 RepID=UPI0027DA007F|nr:uncharacterized protein LOC131062848 [Cryptomeria japonica]